jgi:hypothetical protein
MAPPESDDSTDKNPPLGDVSESEITSLVEDVLKSGKALAIPPLPDAAWEEPPERLHARVIASQMQELAQHISGSGLITDPLEDKDEWWFEVQGKRMGPLSLRKIRYLWDEGELTPDSLCWREGFTTWVSLFRISELAQALAPKRVEPEKLRAVSAALTQNAPPAKDGEWRPSAGAALERSARELLAASQRPPPVAEPVVESEPAGAFPVLSSAPLTVPPPALVAPPKRSFNLMSAVVSGLVSGLVLAAAVFAMRYFGATTQPAPAAALPAPAVAMAAAQTVQPTPIVVTTPSAAPAVPAPASTPPAKSPPAGPAPAARAAMPTRPSPPPRSPSLEEHATADPGDDTRPAAPMRQPAHKGGKPTVEDAFSKEFSTAANEPKELTTSQVMQVVVGHKPAVSACLKEQHERAPDDSGRLVMRWTVHTDGHVSEVGPKGSEPGQEELAACLAREIETWHFPEHDVEHGPVEIPFPF